MDGNIYCYEKCSDVPDFSVVTGIPLLRAEDNSDSSTLSYSYFYNRKYVTRKKISDYRNALKKAGFGYSGYDKGWQAYVYSKGNRTVQLLMNAVNAGECFVQVFEKY